MKQDTPPGHPMSSAEFRRRYASLMLPTIVTVNGHEIGVWVPSRDGTTIEIAHNLSPRKYDPADTSEFKPSSKSVTVTVPPQAKRDAILRRINRKTGDTQ